MHITICESLRAVFFQYSLQCRYRYTMHAGSAFENALGDTSRCYSIHTFHVLAHWPVSERSQEKREHKAPGVFGFKVIWLQAPWRCPRETLDLELWIGGGGGACVDPALSSSDVIIVCYCNRQCLLFCFVRFTRFAD